MGPFCQGVQLSELSGPYRRRPHARTVSRVDLPSGYRGGHAGGRSLSQCPEAPPLLFYLWDTTDGRLGCSRRPGQTKSRGAVSMVGEG